MWKNPFDESKLTAALIRASRLEAKKVYFLQGHGEKSLKDTESTGLSDFKQALEDSSYEVEDLNLLETQSIPQEAHIIVIVGPELQVQQVEINQLNSYLRSGGKLFLALEPETDHNLTDLLKTAGIAYQNNYIVMTRPLVLGRGVASVLGLIFDSEHEVTQDFPQGNVFTLFHWAK